MVNGVKIQKFKRALPEAKNFVAIFGCVLCDTHTQVTGDTFQPNHCYQFWMSCTSVLFVLLQNVFSVVQD